MERDKKKDKQKSFLSNQSSKSDKNNVNISVSIGNNDNLQEDKSINIEEPEPEPEIFDKEEEQQQLIIDSLVLDLKSLIVEFNEKKQRLIDRKVDIPNEVFEIDTSRAGTKEDLLILIGEVKSKIKILDNLILKSEPIPFVNQQIRPSFPSTQMPGPSNVPFGFETFTRTPQLSTFVAPNNRVFQPRTTISDASDKTVKETGTKTGPQTEGRDASVKAEMEDIKEQEEIQAQKEKEAKEKAEKEAREKAQKELEEKRKRDLEASRQQEEDEELGAILSGRQPEEKREENPPEGPAPAPAPAPAQQPPEDTRRPLGDPTAPIPISEEKFKKLEDRKVQLQNYMNLLINTGRSPNGFLVNQREIRQILNIVEMALTNVELKTITDEEADYALSLYTAMDNANGLFPIAKAYYNIRGQGTLAKNDVIELKEADDKQIVEGGRKAFKLYRNDRELIDVQNQVPVYFNSNGDIYNDSIDNKPQDLAEQSSERPEDNPPEAGAETRPPTDDAKLVLENRRDAVRSWAVPPEDENYRATLLNSINAAIQYLEPNDKIKDVYVPVLTNANYDVAAAFAYLNAYDKSANIPFLQPSDKISMTPSSRITGANFLKINDIKYDRVGDYILLNTGFGERIKIKDMKIDGVSRVNPDGFQANDSFTQGRISLIQGGLDAGKNPTIYSVERILQDVPNILDIYKQFKEGN